MAIANTTNPTYQASHHSFCFFTGLTLATIGLTVLVMVAILTFRALLDSGVPAFGFLLILLLWPFNPKP